MSTLLLSRDGHVCTLAVWQTERMVSEVESAVKAVKKKVDKLRNAQRERTKVCTH